jgi:hypothetical protein
MQPAPDDALVALIAKDQIAAFAILYDAFANALDPFSPERDNAEKVFQQDVAALYDVMPDHLKPSLQDFRKAIILRCKRHLAATNKTSGINYPRAFPALNSNPKGAFGKDIIPNYFSAI